ncbi:MAG: hypothetical protein RLO80_11675 [Hyphomonas sp.]
MIKGDMIRLILASLVSPIIAGIFGGAVFGAFSLPTAIHDLETYDASLTRPATLADQLAHMGMSVTGGGAMGLMLGLPILVLAGLPAHAWLVGRSKTDLRYYAIAGLLTGMIGAVPLFGFNLPRALLQDARSVLPLLLLCSLCGMIAASVFWFLRRPDRMAV